MSKNDNTQSCNNWIDQSIVGFKEKTRLEKLFDLVDRAANYSFLIIRDDYYGANGVVDKYLDDKLLLLNSILAIIVNEGYLDLLDEVAMECSSGEIVTIMGHPGRIYLDAAYSFAFNVNDIILPILLGYQKPYLVSGSLPNCRTIIQKTVSEKIDSSIYNIKNLYHCHDQFLKQADSCLRSQYPKNECTIRNVNSQARLLTIQLNKELTKALSKSMNNSKNVISGKSKPWPEDSYIAIVSSENKNKYMFHSDGKCKELKFKSHSRLTKLILDESKLTAKYITNNFLKEGSKEKPTHIIRDANKTLYRHLLKNGFSPEGRQSIIQFDQQKKRWVFNVRVLFRGDALDASSDLPNIIVG